MWNGNSWYEGEEANSFPLKGPPLPETELRDELQTLMKVHNMAEEASKKKKPKKKQMGLVYQYLPNNFLKSVLKGPIKNTKVLLYLKTAELMKM